VLYAAVDELLSGHENLYMIGRLVGHGRAEAHSRADELLGSFELADAASKIAKTYSGGMRRRLDLAASLVGKPRFLYLDEPTTGLDPNSRQQLWELIRGLVADGTTVLLTTQYLEEADRLADEIVVIDHGRVIAAGTPRQLKNRVGGQVLEIHTVDPGQAPRASEILREFAERGSRVHHEKGRALASIADKSCLTAVIRRLEEENIMIDDLALRRSSLDEVFMALTGHVAEPESDSEEFAERSAV